MFWITKWLIWSVLFILARASCYEPSPAFPVPLWSHGKTNLASAFANIEAKLKRITDGDRYDTSSFSVEVTSNTETLWSHFHTAKKQNETRPGTQQVDGNSVYRIASITKLFTTLAILYQHEAGNLSLDNPINKYVSGLEGELPWKDITLRILASQLSGIPREFAQGDLINEIPNPTSLGLPPASKQGLPTCDEYHNYDPPCDTTDLLSQVKKLQPLFAPNQKSTYGNLNFELLGLVLENVTGKPYAEYVQDTIFEPLNMTSTSFTPPPDSHAVLPLGPNYWDIEEGVQNPTGGIYASAADMTKFVRYILTSYNAIATGVNWLMPASWAEGMGSFYGMPFEIFRTDRVLRDSRRPVTFVTKSGGLLGYTSRVHILPEYGLGITVLVGGDAGLLSEIQEIVTVGLVRAAEEVVWKDIGRVYDGLYTSTDSSLNSSMRLTSSPSSGLVIRSFISNGTDALQKVIGAYFVVSSRPWRAQLMPTLLFKDEENQKGEIWRIRGVYERSSKDRGVWDDFCTTDVDVNLYAGLPISEVVFWHDESVVELAAWKVKLKMERSYTALLVQQ